MLREPKSMDECIYFTRRDINNGRVKAWVFREICSKCGKSIMGKPVDKKGKVKIRADYFECRECGNKVEKEEYEISLMANIQYTCPSCGNEGEIQIPFKRKKVKIFDEEYQKEKTTESLRFQCEKCGKNIDITKKMK